MFHGLVVVGHVAFGFAVVIGLAYGQRVEAQMAGDTVHDLFDGDHALRATKAAIGRVGSRVGFTAITIDRRVAQIIGVVGVEHGAVDNGVGQVRRTATVARQVQLDALQAAAGVETDVIFDIKRVALAGHQHVFDPWQAHLRRLPGEACHHGAQAGGAGGLGLLAAKAAAHAAHIDNDLVH